MIRILMLGAPEGTKAGDIAAALEGIEGVENVHHIHLWQIDEHRNSVEAHVVISGEAAPVLVEVKALLRDRFAIAHSTLEVEAPGAGCAGDADPTVPAG